MNIRLKAEHENIKPLKYPHSDNISFVLYSYEAFKDFNYLYLFDQTEVHKNLQGKLDVELKDVNKTVELLHDKKYDSDRVGLVNLFEAPAAWLTLQTIEGKELKKIESARSAFLEGREKRTIFRSGKYFINSLVDGYSNNLNSDCLEKLEEWGKIQSDIIHTQHDIVKATERLVDAYTRIHSIRFPNSKYLNK